MSHARLTGIHTKVGGCACFDRLHRLSDATCCTILPVNEKTGSAASSTLYGFSTNPLSTIIFVRLACSRRELSHHMLHVYRRVRTASWAARSSSDRSAAKCISVQYNQSPSAQRPATQICYISPNESEFSDMV